MPRANLNATPAAWSAEGSQDARLLPLADRVISAAPQPTVSARDLHGYLGVRRDFTTWMRDRIAEYGFREDMDYATAEGLISPISGSAKARVQRSREWFLSLDMAKELAMVERTQRGREARMYFIACEKALREQASRPAVDPVAALSDPLTLRHLLMQNTDRLIEAEAKLRAIADAPRGAVTVGQQLHTVEDAAEYLGTTGRDLWAHMARLGWVWRGRRQPHAETPCVEIATDYGQREGMVQTYSTADKVKVGVTHEGLRRLIALRGH
jgi:anti-repressor protein